MPEREQKQLGTLIQAYVRTRWGNDRDEAALAASGKHLEPQLRERIDILGMDGERLLDVHAEAVLAELEVLEQAAAREDARVTAAADRIRAKEVDRNDAPNPARRNPGSRPGKHRQAAGHGRRRQRSQS